VEDLLFTSSAKYAANGWEIAKMCY